VARDVRHDEAALPGGEEAIGDVDRDSLLALGGESVEGECVVDLGTARADPPRIGLELGDLIVEETARVGEQAADERALAVVDAAAGDESQEAQK
jgi:hypothetical protein